MDELIVVKDFPALRPVVTDLARKSSVRLLAAFGFNGSEVIYVTTDDQCYGYGPNRFGSLGLGVQHQVPTPTLNERLTGQWVANIYYGFGHCIALTASGQLYGWGENTYGQVGIGSFESTSTPQLITKLSDRRVVDVSCGNRHTLAITEDGHVYGWGRNTFGQIGDCTWCWRQWPTPVGINEPIESVSCGKCHSLALTPTGRVYVWGLNDFGQLGRHRDHDMKYFADGRQKERAFGECPQPVTGFDNIVVQKAVCGPNHTLLLTASGHIYAFGFNDYGQIGNGCHANQYLPVRLRVDTKFKDIVAHYDNNLSIGVSNDGRYYVWGYSFKKQKIAQPYDTSKWTAGYTLLDVFARYSGINKTFKTIVFNKDDDNYLLSPKLVRKQTVHMMNIVADANEKFLVQQFDYLFKTQDLSESPDNDLSIESPDEPFEWQSTRKSIGSAANGHQSPDTLTSGRDQEFSKYLHRAFDNQRDYDIVIVFNGQTIYCHKTVIRIRNKRFWHTFERYLIYNPVVDNEEIHLGDQWSYAAVFAFIQYMYSIKPDINGQNVQQLLQLAATYRELELISICCQYLKSTLNLTNICQIYETAVNFGLKSLEDRCIGLAITDWKRICKTSAFLDMDERLSKQLIRLVVTRSPDDTD